MKDPYQFELANKWLVEIKPTACEGWMMFSIFKKTTGSNAYFETSTMLPISELRKMSREIRHACEVAEVKK